MTYTDVGNTCGTGCQSKICIGTRCTRRCDVSTDCPSGWSCSAGGGETFKICRP